jgi:hypothetical protein
MQSGLAAAEWRLRTGLLFSVVARRAGWKAETLQLLYGSIQNISDNAKVLLCTRYYPSPECHDLVILLPLHAHRSVVEPAECYLADECASQNREEVANVVRHDRQHASWGSVES